jgi:hypothetical protein
MSCGLAPILIGEVTIMTPSRSPVSLQKVVIHGRRDIRHAIYQVRHNGALITFMIFLAAGMWYAGAYMHRNPLVMQTMDTRAGCDVRAQLRLSQPQVCKK